MTQRIALVIGLVFTANRFRAAACAGAPGDTAGDGGAEGPATADRGSCSCTAIPTTPSGCGSTRNHGQSDKPTPGGSGRAEDVIELMDHLNIQRAHIHGYSMGGGIVGTLLAMIPERFITAGFGGSGMNETNATYRAAAEAMDEALPKATGAAAAGMERFRSRVAAARPAGSAAAAATATAPPTRPSVDLTKLPIPILAVNGSFDNPYRKTHLTAIAVGAPPSQQYLDAIAKFIDAYDQK